MPGLWRSMSWQKHGTSSAPFAALVCIARVRSAKRRRTRIPRPDRACPGRHLDARMVRSPLGAGRRPDGIRKQTRICLAIRDGGNALDRGGYRMLRIPGGWRSTSHVRLDAAAPPKK